MSELMNKGNWNGFELTHQYSKPTSRINRLHNFSNHTIIRKPWIYSMNTKNVAFDEDDDDYDNYDDDDDVDDDDCVWKPSHAVNACS